MRKKQLVEEKGGDEHVIPGGVVLQNHTFKYLDKENKVKSCKHHQKTRHSVR